MTPSESPEPRPASLFESVRAVGSTPAPERAGQRWGFGAFLLVEAVFIMSAVFITALAASYGANYHNSVTYVLIGSIAPTVLAALAAIVITKVRGNGPVVDLRFGFSKEDVAIGLKLGVVGLVLTYVAANVWAKIVGEQNATSAVGDLVTQASLPVAAAVTMFVFVCFIGPVCEEIIFRGLLWGAVERQQWSGWAALALTTVIFAISHLEPLRTALLLVIAIPIGIARLVTRKLGASIVAHIMNNFLPGLTLLLVSIGVIPA
ncbi:membrane protein [Lentzea sp. NBRC 105346]|uniref:CPBP family intramembrane glutamic endopeptidase n=1 Tax=Lentzea sp. NBRC 105346 TaxID=3032205 RepID=UPI0024A0F396|nr:type II CAAX endopeptidase family protein [Lentzea sp. NBRC 105346]GLZ31331.1 membrane protein [Lentzea sp. NBRC 105346]